jgi:hypothetical protein
MAYQLRRTPPVKGAEGWYIDSDDRKRRMVLGGQTFIPEYNESAFWASAYWNGSHRTNSHLAALDRFYRALRDGDQGDVQQFHGIVINNLKKDHFIELASMERLSLEAIIHAAASWAPRVLKVEIRTPYGDFGYRMDMAGARKFGVVSARDIYKPLAELVGATAEESLSAVGLEPHLREVFTPRVVPPADNGKSIIG